MFRSYRLLIILAIFVTGVSSCNKWLELKPQDGIIKEEFWKTKEQVQSAVNGIYASLLAGSDRPLTEYLWIWGEARADMVAPATQASATELELVNVTMTPNNNWSNWFAVYRTINYCNTLIQLAPGVLANDNTFTQGQLDAAVSEALTIRSLMYFYLVRSFRDVPLKLQATLSDQDIIQIPKSSADTVLNQIVADLKKAEPAAVTSYGNNATNKGRVTKYTINALLADVYLWMGRYTECVAECDKLINSGQFGLVSGNNTSLWFNSLYVEGNSTESIFEFQFDVTRTNPFYDMFVRNRRWTVAPKVVDEVFMIDPANPTSIDIRGEGAAFRGSDFTIFKQVGSSYAGNIRTLDQSIANWIVYRYADILLMKAEALCYLDRGQEAFPLIDQVRIRGRASQITAPNPLPTDKEAIADYILQERSREFAYEGKRWYDLLRYARRRFATDRDFLSARILSAVPANRQQSVIERYRDANSHYFPILQYEIQTNKLLVQNPYYK